MPGLGPKKRADLLKARLRPPTETLGPARPIRVEPITTLISARRASELPDAQATTRRVDAKGRLSWTGVAALLGWEPGPLAAQWDGPWLLLRPADPPARDGRCRDRIRLSADDRIGLPAAVLLRLGHHAGRELLLVPYLDDRVLAIAPPSVALLVGPASLTRPASALTQGAAR